MIDFINTTTPGHIVTVQARKQWRHAGHPYLSGEIERTRVEVEALGLVALTLRECGIWDPTEDAWAEGEDPCAPVWRAIRARGRRPAYELQEVRMEDVEDCDEDPILQAVALKESGDHAAAQELLEGLLAADLRCLDAYAHLGNAEFDLLPDVALRHYEIGVRIAEWSLGPGFDGVLAWGHIENRPFLRCLHGYGLALWRLDRFAEATRVFERMLWLSPNDNQGIRFLLPEVRAGERWSADKAGS
jgi:tetratricopeptide (TPR) repeat protein